MTDLSYLYQYGEYISANEKSIAAYLNTLDQSVIDDMAATFVNGYVRGFELYKIDLSAKKNVQLRANIGFERVLRSTIRQFEALGLSVIVCRDAIHSINKTAGSSVLCPARLIRSMITITAWIRGYILTKLYVSASSV